jgi:hypothetical protein
MNSQITVFRSADESAGEDAAKVQEMLQQAGVSAALVDDTAPGVPSGTYEVRVDREDLARAEELVAQFPPEAELEDVDPSHDLDLVTVFQSAGASNEFEAMSIKSLIEDGGISAIIVGDSRYPNLGQEVRVAKEHEARARQLIKEAVEAGPAAADEAEQSTENI